MSGPASALVEEPVLPARGRFAAVRLPPSQPVMTQRQRASSPPTAGARTARPSGSGKIAGAAHQVRSWAEAAISVAGNVADTDELGSMEYGVDHLGTPVLLVLGHTSCGAVTAVATGAEVHGHIPPLVDNIVPAVVVFSVFIGVALVGVERKRALLDVFAVAVAGRALFLPRDLLEHRPRPRPARRR